MASQERDEGAGVLIICWVAICIVTGQSLAGLLFLIVGVLWVIPSVWDRYVSKTFDNDTNKILMLIAILCLILAIFSII